MLLYIFTKWRHLLLGGSSTSGWIFLEELCLDWLTGAGFFRVRRESGSTRSVGECYLYSSLCEPIDEKYIVSVSLIAKTALTSAFTLKLWYPLYFPTKLWTCSKGWVSSSIYSFKRIANCFWIFRGSFLYCLSKRLLREIYMGYLLRAAMKSSALSNFLTLSALYSSSASSRIRSR